jgi:hypothetical protein
VKKRDKQLWVLQWAMADVERLWMGGYETFMAGKDVMVRKRKDCPQEPGLYKYIVHSWSNEDLFAIKTWLKIEKEREELQRQQQERIKRVQEKSASVEMALSNLTRKANEEKKIR